jgi:hypothetical protein
MSQTNNVCSVALILPHKKQVREAGVKRSLRQAVYSAGITQWRPRPPTTSRRGHASASYERLGCSSFFDGCCRISCPQGQVKVSDDHITNATLVPPHESHANITGLLIRSQSFPGRVHTRTSALKRGHTGARFISILWEFGDAGLRSCTAC